MERWMSPTVKWGIHQAESSRAIGTRLRISVKHYTDRRIHDPMTVLLPFEDKQAVEMTEEAVEDEA
jgi:hypothetical protein